MEELDETDKRILRILQKDSKLTTKELAAKVNLSPTPVFERQRRLEREGYIEKYVAVVNPHRVGNGLIVLCNIRLKQHTPSSYTTVYGCCTGFGRKLQSATILVEIMIFKSRYM